MAASVNRTMNLADMEERLLVTTPTPTAISWNGSVADRLPSPPPFLPQERRSLHHICVGQSLSSSSASSSLEMLSVPNLVSSPRRLLKNGVEDRNKSRTTKLRPRFLLPRKGEDAAFTFSCLSLKSKRPHRMRRMMHIPIEDCDVHPFRASNFHIKDDGDAHRPLPSSLSSSFFQEEDADDDDEAGTAMTAVRRMAPKPRIRSHISIHHHADAEITGKRSSPVISSSDLEKREEDKGKLFSFIREDENVESTTPTIHCSHLLKPMNLFKPIMMVDDDMVKLPPNSPPPHCLPAVAGEVLLVDLKTIPPRCSSSEKTQSQERPTKRHCRESVLREYQRQWHHGKS